jgi:anthranilate phosphoribosyltransferase
LNKINQITQGYKMAFTITEGITSLVNGESLSRDQTQEVLREIMSGKAQDAQIASFLTALRMRGETIDNIHGAALVMREFASQIHPKTTSRLVDTCGTGGDHAGTFNISTLAAIVAAGAGVTIAKHGNRSVSSSCGSADLLEGLGVKIDLEPKDVEQMIEKIGIGFMFAPKFHPAMKYAMPVRKALKMRTIFNILGPLTNPANAQSHVLGVFDEALVEPITKVMAQLGAEHVFVVHSAPGIDEIVPISEIKIGEVKDGQINYQTLTPKQLKMKKMTKKDVQGGDLATNLTIAKGILTNQEKGTKRQVVILNAAYAIYASGITSSLEKAMEMADESLTSGKALDKLHQMVIESNGDQTKYAQFFS